MSNPFKNFEKRKKRPSGRGRDFAISGLRNVTEVKDPWDNEQEAPAVPKKQSRYLDDLLGQARQGGPDYVSLQKKKEEQQKREEYNRRHGRTEEPRKATAAPPPPTTPNLQPPVLSITAGLPNIETLQKLNQNLKKSTTSGNDSRGREKEYNPNDPLLPRSSTLSNNLDPQPTPQRKVSCRVRLCKHLDFLIDWDPFDPDNHRGSWNARIEKYFNAVADYEKHKTCPSYNPLERSNTMVKRILQKYHSMGEHELSGDGGQQGNAPRRVPNISLVEREVNILMLHMVKGNETDEFVERREQATGMRTNAAGKFVQDNRLSSFKLENNGFAEPGESGRFSKDAKKLKETGNPKAAETTKPKITKKRISKVSEMPKPTPKPTSKPTSKSIPKLEPEPKPKSKPKAPELTAKERAILTKLKQAGTAELEKTVEDERKAKLEKEEETEPDDSEDEIDKFLFGSPTAPKPAKKASAEKTASKTIKSDSSDGLNQSINAALNAPSSPEPFMKPVKIKIKTRFVKVPVKVPEKVPVNDDSDSSDGLSQAINAALHALSSPEPAKKPTKIKVKKRLVKKPVGDSSDSDDASPRIRPKKASALPTPTKKRPAKQPETDDSDSDAPSKPAPKPIKKVKRKASADKDDEDQPPKKKGRKEYKSAHIITTSDGEAGDELISVGSQMSDEDAVVIKEAVKEVTAAEKTATFTKVTKVTETVESVTMTETSAETKKRKLGDSTTTETAPPSPKKAKLTLGTSEETLTPHSRPRKSPSPRKKSPAPLPSPFSSSPKRKSLAEQEDEEAVSLLSQPRNTPPREPEQITPISSPKTPVSKPEQTTPLPSPESSSPKKRKSPADEDEETTVPPCSPQRKRVKFTEGVVSPTQQPRKMSIEYITSTEKNGDATTEETEAQVVDATTEAIDEPSASNSLPTAGPEAEQDKAVGADSNGDESREMDTLSEPGSDDSLFN